MAKLKLHTPDLTAANIDRILELFPNCKTTAKDEKGKLKRAIDFDLLKQELSSDLVEGPQERYRLDWPGKREALALANTPVSLTLRPCRVESVDFENTKNLYIEGDNLDALKLLQETYLGKVKMIYIDPPYNTGNDFIYDDNFSMIREEYRKQAGEVDEHGNVMFDEEKWKQNSSNNGRFHSEWLSMMYSRVKLARNLLREDGILFVSIDDNECSNLIKLCEEIFGADNYCGNLVWEKKKKPSFLNVNMGTVTEYVAAFARDRSNSPPFAAGRVEDGKKYPFNNAGNGIKTLTFPEGSVTFRCSDGLISPQDMSEGNIVTRLLDPVHVKNGRNENAFRLEGEWRYSQNKLNEFAEEKAEILISKIPFRPNYINRSGETKKSANLLSYRTNGVPTNEDATEEVRTLFGSDVMSYPKPTGLIAYLVSAVVNDEELVLDFFSGSATTAHAVMQLNAEDGGNRRHIMVQLPEPCDAKSEAFKAGYKTIAEIGKERIRRAGKKILQEWQAKQAKEQSAERDLLHPPYTITDPPSPPDIGFRVVFRDDGFGDDSTRINVEQIFKLLSPGTEIKSL